MTLLIGWKEDFHMTYSGPVPAQEAQPATCKRHEGFLKGLVAGHLVGAISQPALTFQIIRLNGSMTTTATMLLASTGPLSRPKATSGRPQIFFALSPQGSIVVA